MAKLALALADDNTEGDRRIQIDRRSRGAVVGALGQTVLLYRLVPGSFVMFFATGKVTAIEIGTDGVSLECRLGDLRPFTAPPIRTDLLIIPSVQRLLNLTVSDFDKIIEEGRAEMPPTGASEADVSFAGPLRNQSSMVVYRQVLEGWDYRCAVTGRQFSAGEVPHRELRLAYLRPRDQGGPLHVRNLIPMIPAAEQAWVRGILSATFDFRIVGVIEEIGLELFDRIERIGRLHVPSDVRYQPDPEHLAYHRARIFGA